MERLPEDIFNDLMLDMIGKYSRPPVNAADVPDLGLPGPSEPQPQTDTADFTDEGEDASYSSPAGSGTDPQEEDTSLQGDGDSWRSGSPAETEDLTSDSPLEARNWDSRTDISSPGHADCRRSGSPAETEDLASDSCSESSSLDSIKDTLSPGHADHRRSDSPPERKERDSDSRLESTRRDSGSSSGHASRRRSDSPPERTERYSDSRSESRHQDSRTSSGHAGRRRSDSPPERAERYADSRSESRHRDSRTSSGHASRRRSDSPPERTERYSNSRSESRLWDSRTSSGHADRDPDSPSEPSGQKNVISKTTENESTNGYELTRLKAVLCKGDFAKECEEELSQWAYLDSRIFKGVYLRCVNAVTFTNLIMAFRIPPSPSLQEKCFSRKWRLFHHSFKKPTMDSEIYDLLCEKCDPESRGRFVNNVEPLDKKLEHFQWLLMKATMPLFVICNFFEQPGLQFEQKLPSREETLVFCRESMIMCGQVFYSIMALRQERVLETFNLRLEGEPPSPSHFPNIETASLFGPKYISELSRFLKGRTRLAATPRKEADPHNLGGLVDEKTTCAIEKLARFVAEMGLEMDVFNVEKMASNPNFWFLTVKESPAYKLYQKKLAEFRQSLGSSSDSRKWQDLTLNSQPKAPNPQGFALAPKGMLSQPLKYSSGSAGPPKKDYFIAPLAPPLRKRSRPLNALAVPAKRVFQKATPEVLFPVVAKTKESEDKLPHFVVQEGQEKEKLEKLTVSQKYWFLNQMDTPEYRLYQNKLTALRQVKTIPPLPPKQQPQPPVQLKSSMVEQTVPPNSNPQNPSGQGSEAQGALLLLSELYDSDEESSASRDLGPRDIKLRAAQLQKAQLRKRVLKDTDPKGPKLPHDPNLGIRLL